MAKVLVISPEPSHPQDAGNRARIFTLLLELQKDGHKIHFCYLGNPWQKSNPEAMERQWDSFQRIQWRRPSVSRWKKWYDAFSKKTGGNRVLPYRIDDWFDDSVVPSVQNMFAALKPDVVIVEYAYVSKVLTFLGNEALKILDTHDVFGNRAQLFYQNKLEPLWFYTTKREEKKGVDRADVILAIQPQEAEYFRNVTEKKVITVGHMVSPAESCVDEPTLPPKLLFVGSSNPSNLAGIKWFLENVFQILRIKFPEIELNIAGNACDSLKSASGINLLGTVKDLSPFYRNASVVVNPLQFGTGLKIKTVEALAMKRPLVTTPIGASGIEDWAGRAFLCVGNPKDFAAAIVKIIASKDLQEILVKGAEEFIVWYNRQAFSPLKDELDMFLKKTKKH